MVKIKNAVNEFGQMLNNKLDSNTNKIKIKLSDIAEAQKTLEEKYNPPADEFVKK